MSTTAAKPRSDSLVYFSGGTPLNFITNINFSSWKHAQPALLIGAAAVLLQTPPGRRVFRKVVMYTHSVVFFVLVKTPKSKPKGVDLSTLPTSPTAQIDVVFVRHAESVWNQAFNRGFGLGFFSRLLCVFARELALFATLDSVLLDSPLSKLGRQQAQDLYEFLEGNLEPLDNNSEHARALLAVLRGPLPACSSDDKSGCGPILFSSNLRRAIQTAFGGLRGVANRSSRVLHIHGDLQEFSRNMDCVPLLSFSETPTKLSGLLGQESEIALDSALAANHVFTVSASTRLEQEAARIALVGGGSNGRVIVVVGHSGWFRSFFRTFLPAGCEHPAKSRKIHNCGVVGFKLNKYDVLGGSKFAVEPESVVRLYKGFK